MLDVVFLRPKTGLSGLHPHFFFPQVESLALFAPTSGIKDVFRVKNRLFWCGKNNVKKVVEMSLQIKRGDAY